MNDELFAQFTASAGNGGVATSGANGGAVSLGDINSGGNAGNAIGVGNTMEADPTINGGSVVTHPAWGVIALPRLARLYVRKQDRPGIDPKHRPASRTEPELAVELLRWAKGWLGLRGKTSWVVADGAYAKAASLKPAKSLGMTVVSRLRCDAALWSLPPVVPSDPRSPGRPRVYGTERISPAKRSGPARGAGGRPKRSPGTGGG